MVAERDPRIIADALQPLLIGAELRRRFGHAGERLVDGRGTERVAGLILQVAHAAERDGRKKSRGRGQVPTCKASAYNQEERRAGGVP